MNDTSPEVYKKQMEILLAKTAEQRIMAISDSSDFIKQMAFKRILKQHPNFTHKQVVDEFIKMQFPEECAKMKLFQ